MPECAGVCGNVRECAGSCGNERAYVWECARGVGRSAREWVHMCGSERKN